MKKLLLIGAFVAFFGFQSQAQEVGLRFGQVVGGNVAIDGIFEIADFSRVHADVSFGGSGNGLGVEALWDFMYKPLSGEDLKWYVGVGPSLYLASPLWLGASGEIGLSYEFKSAPVSVSADWRPTLWLIDQTDFSVDGFGLNVRYIFGK